MRSRRKKGRKKPRKEQNLERYTPRKDDGGGGGRRKGQERKTKNKGGRGGKGDTYQEKEPNVKNEMNEDSNTFLERPLQRLHLIYRGGEGK